MDRPRLVLVAMALSAIPTLLGCSASSSSATTDPCPTTSKCQSDRPDPTACRRWVADTACGGLYRAYVTCAAAKQTCADSGTTDLDRLAADCRDSWAAFRACAAPEGDAGSPPGDGAPG